MHGAHREAPRHDRARRSEPEAPVGLEEDLRRARPAVVGRGQRGGVGPGIGDRDEVAATKRREVVRAEGVGRFADRPVDAGRFEGEVIVGLDRAALAGERHDRVAGAVERGPDELGHPGVDDDLAPAAIADVEDAGDQPAGTRHECAPWLDREAARPPVRGDRVEQRGELAGEALRRGTGLVERQDREPATDIERVEVLEPAAEQPDDRETAPDGIPPGIDRAQLRPDVQVDPARPDGTAGVRADPLDEPGRLGLGHPELRRLRRRPRGPRWSRA